MDRYVKNFIIMSIAYLAIASVLGVMMLVHPSYLGVYKFTHSHLMLLGWVSMMIYGVGYHILPKFAGRFLKHPKLAETQFCFANIGLVGMVFFDVMRQRAGDIEAYKGVIGAMGTLEVISIFMFFYNMVVTLLGKPPEED